MSTLTQATVTTANAHIVDACMRLKLPFRLAPHTVKPLAPIPGMLYGPVVPVRHYGSVDVFLEALESAPTGSILVIDNGGRTDEACIGDLIVLEVKNAGLKGIVLWGLHRDTRELLNIGLPVLSQGACPSGPARLDAREPEVFESARIDSFMVNRNDTAFIDQDGALFLETAYVAETLEVAESILAKERKQVEAALQGISLRDQFQFRSFLEQREKTEGYTFRQHLAAIAKAIEE